MFVGDSLQRGQWQSFVCLVDSVIPEGQKKMKRGRVHSVFTVKVPTPLLAHKQVRLFFYTLYSSWKICQVGQIRVCIELK